VKGVRSLRLSPWGDGIPGVEKFVSLSYLLETIYRRLPENEIVFSRSRKAKIITTIIH